VIKDSSERKECAIQIHLCSQITREPDNVLEGKWKRGDGHWFRNTSPICTLVWVGMQVQLTLSRSSILLSLPFGLSPMSRLHDTPCPDGGGILRTTRLQPCAPARHPTATTATAACPRRHHHRYKKKMALGNSRILPIVRHHTFSMRLPTTYHLDLSLLLPCHPPETEQDQPLHYWRM
jgi:hypothetical protein